ncbi:hypothetical protein GCU67_16160 [Modestobacter muralis]|uniref:Uncharacterized protein n=1 Tax=Modestobacter muralis TaxID=1608614 RepID=A0A6P0F2Z6_9ACTN|nr:hypothetical protein [Modestobacter muralis]NEK95688.1 hypothetical protein [Modestobacter muralis]NEN52576.1 hypothetical protein [Modestobacter muralis]
MSEPTETGHTVAGEGGGHRAAPAPAAAPHAVPPRRARRRQAAEPTSSTAPVVPAEPLGSVEPAEPAGSAALPPAAAPASSPGQPVAQRRARHRAARPSWPERVRVGLLWPVLAVLVVGLVGARMLRGIPLPGDGDLAAPAFALSRGTTDLAPLSPEGLAAVHGAVHATVTRAFERHATLVAAERELLLVVLVLSAVLLWRTARRLGVPDAGCALAVLAFGALPGLVPLHAVASPAALAVPWLLLVAWLLTSWLRPAGDHEPAGSLRGRVPVAVGLLAAAAVVLAVLLAPDVLLFLVAGLAAAAAGRGDPARRAAAAAGGVLLLTGGRALVERWAPEAADPARWGADRTGVLVTSGVLLLVGVLAAVLLPRWRPLGVALAAVALLSVAPPSQRVSALLLSLPLAALLVGALGALAAARLPRSVLARPRTRLVAGLAGAVALVVVAAVAASAVSRTPRSDFGATADAQLVDWLGGQLPDEAVVTADPALTAQLVHAGADPDRVLPGTELPVPASTGPTAPVLQVTSGAAPAAGTPVARFGPSGELTVTDPQAVAPTPEQLDTRRQLGTALLANPTNRFPAADAALLTEGRVDPRLLTLLAGIGAQYGVGVESLPAVPGEPADAPVRQAVVTTVGGTSLAADPAAAERFRGWLGAQKEPYVPDRISEVPGGLLIGYDLVRDPDALVTAPRR